jgi:hypothetical protein
MGESILAEIVAAFIVGAIFGTYRKFIIPYVKEHFTERIKLHAIWVSDVNFGSGNIHKVKLTVNKMGNDVKGEIEFISGRHTGKKYPISGRFSSNILTFNYFPLDPKSTSQGSGTYKRLMDGELLKGYFAYFSQEQNLIDTVECEFIPLKI